MRSWRKKGAAGLISFLLYLGIFALSSLPASVLPAGVPDFIPHFCEYALLAFFSMHLFNDPGKPQAMAAGCAVLLLLAFLDEWHQAFVPGRFCSLKDLLFDALGALAGIAACLVLRRWAAKPHESRWARRLGDYIFRA
ncbi:MAG: VanZ family protein [Candidatus Aminicenantes bacterium]|nr:VanZ family protein [Candidatus Aminicenantes bacterium]